MKKSVIKFSENIQLAMGVVAACGIVVIARYTLDDTQLLGFHAPDIAYVVAGVVAMWALRSAGVTLTLTPTSLTRRGPFGEVRIRWDEMDRLEIGPSCFWLVFHGNGNRIWMRKPVSSFESWFKDESDENHEDPILASILDLAQQHGVPTESGILTPFKTSRA